MILNLWCGVSLLFIVLFLSGDLGIFRYFNFKYDLEIFRILETKNDLEIFYFSCFENEI